MSMRFPRWLLASAALAFCSSGALATWSIIVSDRATGEVVVAGATCLAGFDLEKGSAVMLVGIGGAAAQSSLDGSGKYRRIIWDELKKGTAPSDILDILEDNDTRHQEKQYGIVDLQGRSVSFSGSQDGAWAGHAFGTSGTITYAIQGNVLTGSPVIEKAKQALLETRGDLATRVIAAMLAARDMGGDGRCSCDQTNPTRCGSPPPKFDKSAHCSYLAISRIGDVDGDCTKALGCVAGDYYLDLTLPLRGPDPDPVFILAKEVEKWRTQLLGRPDHLLSLKTIDPGEVPADGVATATLTIKLRDVDVNPLKHGGAIVTVEHDATSAHSSSIGAVVDHGDGSYSCTLTAGTQPGADVFRIVLDDGIRPVTLYPFPTLDVVPPLWSRLRELSASSPTPIELDLHGPAARAFVLFTADRFAGSALAPTLFPSLRHALGRLDARGAAHVTLAPGSADLTPLIGNDLSFQFVTLMPVDFASNVWPIHIVE